MLRRLGRPALVCAVAVVMVVGSFTSAYSQENTCDDPQALPVLIELGLCPDPDDDPPAPPGERRCYHLDVEVPCESEYGTWIGTPGGPLYLAPENSGLGQATGNSTAGCYAVLSPDQPPPPEELGPDAEGAYYVLRCFGDASTEWPPALFTTGVWLSSVETPPDPEEIALNLLAQIGLSAPDVQISPPPTGSVLLGMPVWLSTAENDQTFGPIEDEACVLGVCVGIEAQAESITWDMGDDGSVTCSRDQNVAWEPGMNFMAPGNACHYFYDQPSRDQADGRYQVTATTSFYSEWRVLPDGASGEFEDVTDFCGPGGNELCQSTASILVEELQVLSQR